MTKSSGNSTKRRSGNIRTEDIRERTYPTKHHRLNDLRDNEALEQIKDYTYKKEQHNELS